ncbi:MAG: hypothetical protein WA324_11445, partial [Bryobacteraceae bacterium]
MFIAESSGPDEAYPEERGRNYRLLRDGTEIGCIELAPIVQRERITQIRIGDKSYTADYEYRTNYREHIRGHYRICADGEPALIGDQAYRVHYPIVLNVPPPLAIRKKFWGQTFIIQQAHTDLRVYDKTIRGTVKQIERKPYQAVLQATLD